MPEDLPPILKPLAFVGAARTELAAMPIEAKRAAGFQLDRVQRGLMPEDFKPMPAVGPGVFEIRIREEGRAHRVFYVARFEEAVYALHAFEKKTQRTPKQNLETGRRRYRALLDARQNIQP